MLRTGRHNRLGGFLLLLAAFAGAARMLATGGDGSDGRMIGHDPTNTRNQPFEHRIRTANVHRLAPKWVATTAGDVSATPARRCSRRPRSSRRASSTARSAGRTRTGERHRVPAANGGFTESCEQPGVLLEVGRRVRPEDGRAALVVPRAGPRPVAAGVRQPAGER